MILGHIEHRRDLTLLGAVAHKARVAATAQRQRKCIQQDRFARAGLPGEDCQAFEEIDVEPLMTLFCKASLSSRPMDRISELFLAHSTAFTKFEPAGIVQAALDVTDSDYFCAVTRE